MRELSKLPKHYPPAHSTKMEYEKTVDKIFSQHDPKYRYLILSSLTMRVIRDMIKSELSLDDSISDSPEFKAKVKQIVEKKLSVITC